MCTCVCMHICRSIQVNAWSVWMLWSGCSSAHYHCKSVLGYQHLRKKITWPKCAQTLQACFKSALCVQTHWETCSWPTFPSSRPQQYLANLPISLLPKTQYRDSSPSCLKWPPDCFWFWLYLFFLTLLDLSATFDTIDHSILLTRLDSTFGFRDLALSFFRSYLQDRTQVVTVSGIKSSPSLLTCGVPQGSVLGPILFILYTQPLSDVISHHSVSHHVFADDTELYKSDSLSEAFAFSRTIEACISVVKVWEVQNKTSVKWRQNRDSSHRLCSWNWSSFFCTCGS